MTRSKLVEGAIEALAAMEPGLTTRGDHGADHGLAERDPAAMEPGLTTRGDPWIDPETGEVMGAAMEPGLTTRGDLAIGLACERGRVDAAMEPGLTTRGDRLGARYAAVQARVPQWSRV